MSKSRSYSQLDQVRRCGWAYKLARVDRAPKRPSWAQVAGVLIHQATEVIDHAIHEGETSGEALENGAADRVREVWPATEAEFSGNYPPDQWTVFGKQGAEWWNLVGVPSALRAYIDWRLSKPSWTLAEVPGFGPAIEVPFQLGLGELQVNGWIDRIFVVEDYGGLYFPVDIKSGKKPPTNEQLALYSLALHQGLGWKSRYGFYVYNLKSGAAKQTPAIDLLHWTYDDLSGIYNTADEIIRRGLFIPKPGDACFTCDVQDHCKFKQAAL